jgi:hypothetical protein
MYKKNRIFVQKTKHAMSQQTLPAFSSVLRTFIWEGAFSRPTDARESLLSCRPQLPCNSPAPLPVHISRARRRHCRWRSACVSVAFFWNARHVSYTEPLFLLCETCLVSAPTRRLRQATSACQSTWSICSRRRSVTRIRI